MVVARDKVPHHSTFSINRLDRFRESDILRHVFERVVAACMANGLVKGEGFAVDASVMEANASRYHGKAPDELDWTDTQRQKRAVAEYLAALEDEGADADRKLPKLISPVDRVQRGLRRPVSAATGSGRLVDHIETMQAEGKFVMEIAKQWF